VAAWPALVEKIQANRIAMLTLARGDRIASGSSSIKILSPDRSLAESAELNDTGIVALTFTPELRTLFTADIGSNIEQYLLAQGDDLRADVLKIPHHGSKYSSSAEFLRAVNPRVAVIEVGTQNTYGHPAPQTLARLASSTRAEMFRTDQNGTVAVFTEDGKLKIESEK
jgi:competence protein ComEC